MHYFPKPMITSTHKSNNYRNFIPVNKDGIFRIEFDQYNGEMSFSRVFIFLNFSTFRVNLLKKLHLSRLESLLSHINYPDNLF